MRLEQEETVPSAGRLKNTTCGQLGESFQEADAPHDTFPQKAAESSLISFILSASADWVLIFPNIPCTYMDPLAFGID